MKRILSKIWLILSLFIMIWVWMIPTFIAIWKNNPIWLLMYLFWWIPAAIITSIILVTND